MHAPQSFLLLTQKPFGFICLPKYKWPLPAALSKGSLASHEYPMNSSACSADHSELWGPALSPAFPEPRKEEKIRKLL